MDRYHKAARDGMLDVIKEASKREINSKDEAGMSMVLWAAFEGKLDALRLLVGKGGDPDSSDQFGNTALHLASARGHFQCVDFLVKFKCNIFALDIDHHTPQNLAAINNRDNILRYLDGAATQMETTNPKKATKLKEEAKKYSEKRIKDFAKKQKQLQTQQGQLESEKSSMLKAMKQKLWSGSHGNLSKMREANNFPQENTKFSDLVGGTMTGGQRGPAQRKVQQIKARQASNDFKIGEIESNGKRSVRSIQGTQRDSEILYVGTYDQQNLGKRGKITDVFDYETASNEDAQSGRNMRHAALSRCISQPDLLDSGANDDLAEDVKSQRPSGLFDRPMMGSLAFPRSMSAVLSQINNDHSSTSTSSSNKKPSNKKQRNRSQLVNISDSDSGSEEDEEQSQELMPLERFLKAWGLEEYLALLQKHQIDLETLIILTEDDLKSLGLPLGPYRRLCVAIQERKTALTSPGAIIDSRL